MSTDDDSTGAGLVRALVRWHAAGAVWRVVDRQSEEVTVALLRCDGGEEVERLSSADPVWLAYLTGGSGSED